MADDYPGFIQIVSELFETKYGSWQQPDEMDPCRVGLGGCPVVWSSPYELRRLTISWTRVFASAPPQDAAMTTHHFLNLTGGNPDATWTSADYTTVETAADTWWNTLKARYADEYILSGYSWRADGPSFRPHGTELSPTLRNTARSVAGSDASAQSLPPQAAISVTETTPAKYTALDVEGSGDQLRNRWGRFYLPPPIAQYCVAGRISTAMSSDVADATEAWYNTCSDADLIPVMYSPTTGNAWAIEQLHVDDIWDVIRSRRFVTPLTRNSRTLHTP